MRSLLQRKWWRNKESLSGCIFAVFTASTKSSQQIWYPEVSDGLRSRASGSALEFPSCFVQVAFNLFPAELPSRFPRVSLAKPVVTAVLTHDFDGVMSDNDDILLLVENMDRVVTTPILWLCDTVVRWGVGWGAVKEGAETVNEAASSGMWLQSASQPDEIVNQRARRWFGARKAYSIVCKKICSCCNLDKLVIIKWSCCSAKPY